MENTEQQTKTRRERGEGSLYLRGRTWWICVSVNGKQMRESCGTSDPDQALKHLKRKLKEVHAFELAGKPLVTSRDRRKTISDLMDALEKDFQIRGILTAQAKSQLKRVKADFAGIRAMSLTKEHVDRYIEERLAADNAPASINRTTGLLKQGFTFAELPTPKIRKLDESGNVRTGFFTELEIRRVMANLDADVADFTLFGWLTGMRKSEIASLRWQDVTGDELRLRSENSKNGEPRVVPFEGQLAELMERRKKARQYEEKEVTKFSPLIFHRAGQPIAEFRKSWKTACCFAGVGKLVCPKCSEQVDAKRKCAKCGAAWRSDDLVYVGKIFHDLRRSSARNMLQAGVPQAIAMQVTGHKTDSMFRRYAIVAPNDVRTALRLTQEHTASEMAKATATVN